MRRKSDGGSLQKVRPISAKHNENKLKTEISQGQQHLPSFTFQPKYSKRYARLITAYNQPEASRIISRKIPKERQELLQQNLQLKAKINKLQSEISLQRGQLELQRRKTFKYTKKLDRQFEKEIYWTGNNQHLISGIKNQYEKLKQQYQQKCNQCVEFKKFIEFTNRQQYKIYAETLQQNNRQLTKKLQALLSQKSNNVTQKQSNNEYTVLEISLLLQKTKKKLQQLSQKHRKTQTELKEKNKKIQFLQKLLIQKDNNQYHSIKKVKKIERDNTILQQNCYQLKEKLSKVVQQHQNQLQTIRLKIEGKIQKEYEMFQKNIKQKDIKINKLEKQVSYLNTLLSYWKPTDQLKNQQEQLQQSNAFQDPTSLPINISHKKSQINEKDDLKTSIIKRKQSFAKSNLSQTNRNSFQPSLKISGNDQQISELPIQHHRRQRKTAKEKHSEHGVKSRKVNVKDVEEFSQLIKYRMIGNNISIEKAKLLFNCSVKTEDQWVKQYITMKQVKQILQNIPFNLNQETSHILSRYIVEDCDQQHIYCDEENQISRTVAKSILKSFIGQFEIHNEQLLKKEWKEILTKFQQNLRAALSSMAPNGLIQGSRLLQLVNSLGIEISQSCKRYLLGKMSVESDSMENMKYEIIFRL